MKKILLIISILFFLASQNILETVVYSKKVIFDEIAQPFIIKGEGLLIYTSVDLLPTGKLLAKTPTSYKLIDPFTAEVQSLPKGFPEGEITQWQDDFAVVRVVAREVNPTMYMYTIWPTMANTIVSQNCIHFIDKDGTYVSLLYNASIPQKDNAIIVRSISGAMKWQRSFKINSNYNYYDGVFKISNGLLAFNSGDEIIIFDSENGDILKIGNIGWNYSKYAQPSSNGSLFSIGQNIIRTVKDKRESRNSFEKMTSSGTEIGWYDKFTDTIYYNQFDMEGNSINKCEYPVPKRFSVVSDVTFMKDGIFCMPINNHMNFIDIINGIVVDILPVSFFPDRNEFFCDQDNIYLIDRRMICTFSLSKKRITNYFVIPGYMESKGDFEIISLSKQIAGNNILLESFSVKTPSSKAIGRGSFSNYLSHSDGVIEVMGWTNIKAHSTFLNRYDGTFEFLGCLENSGGDLGKFHSWKNQIYAFAQFRWAGTTTKYSQLCIVKIENGKWKNIFTLADPAYAPFNYSFYKGKFMYYKGRNVNVIELETLKIKSFSVPNEIFFTRCYILDDKMVFFSFGAQENKCAVIYLSSGEIQVYDSYIGCDGKNVYVKKDEKYFILNGRILTQISMIKQLDSIRVREFTIGGFQLLDMEEGKERINYSAQNKCFVTRVYNVFNGYQQIIPIWSAHCTWLPKELYQWVDDIYPNNIEYVAEPSDDFLSKLYKCASYSIKIKSDENKNFVFEIEAFDFDFNGTLWFQEFSEEIKQVELLKPMSFALKPGERTKILFNSENNKTHKYAVVVSGNGFMDVRKSILDKTQNIDMPLFAGMQAGPSGDNVVNAFFWEAQKGDEQ